MEFLIEWPELTHHVCRATLFLTENQEVSLMRQGFLHRWFAVLLFIFAFADLSADMVSPQLCCEGIGNLVVSGVSSTQPANDAIAFKAADDFGHEQSSDPLNIEEDCFCCCSHILPSVHFDVAVLDIKPPTSVLTNASLPTPPPQKTFRPPRLS